MKIKKKPVERKSTKDNIPTHLILWILKIILMPIFLIYDFIKNSGYTHKMTLINKGMLTGWF